MYLKGGVRVSNLGCRSIELGCRNNRSHVITFFEKVEAEGVVRRKTRASWTRRRVRWMTELVYEIRGSYFGG